MILVTGASGYVGGAALRRLAGMGRPVAAMVRNADSFERTKPAAVPARVGDYDDRPSLERAFEDVATLLFVASDGDGRDVMRHHENIIEAAAASGVAHIVFTSIIDVDEVSPFYYAPVYGDSEQRLAACGVPWTILRCGLYSDFVVTHWLQPARRTGEVSVPLGKARLAPVSRDDVAEAVAAAAAIPGDGTIHALTGPRPYTLDEIAAAASAAWGISMRYLSCSPADYLRQLWSEMDDPWPHAFSTLCASIAQERYSRISGDFERLVGRPAESFENFLRRKAPGD